MIEDRKILIFTSLTLVLVLASLLGCWYNQHEEIHADLLDDYVNYFTYRESDYSSSLTAQSSVINTDGDIEINSYSISELRQELKQAITPESKYNYLYDSFDTLDNTFIIVIISFVFVILVMLFTIFSQKKQILEYPRCIFAVLMPVFIISAPIYFMISYSNFLDKVVGIFPVDVSGVSFWYSYSIQGYSTELGPGYAWYLMFIATAFALISSYLILKKYKKNHRL